MIGKTLVHYEISAQIGRGGMGEVYQAKDTKLGRDVAIKVLPEEFARDTERVARFQREAKLLASLNHPNIAAIHGLEEADGTHFLVMELIEGDTLRDRIKSGPIPVEEALKLALQMAEALEAAHEKGVIHRDFKPANIKITPDGKVKVLDFGLAKAYVGDQENLSPMDSPTISAAATQKGVILGTAAYMSPEQARGKPVDKRADIWAFGVVLFEMLTGRSAFSGDDVTDTLASVVKLDANMEILPANLHPRLCELLNRCLQKDTRRRYSGIGDARYEIEQVLADPSGIFTQPVSIEEPRRKLRSTLALIVSAVILIALIVGAAFWSLRPTAPRQVTRFSVDLPEGYFPSSVPSLAISPDGSQFAVSTSKGIYLRSMDELIIKPVAGTIENTRQLFFSPDGESIGYWSVDDNQLKKVSVAGGESIPLCKDEPSTAYYHWGTDGNIYFASGKGIMRVSENGGAPETVITPKNSEMFFSPQLLPDEKSVIFTLNTNEGFKIAIQSLHTNERTILFKGATALYLPTEHIIYVIDKVLYAVPFDIDKLEPTGKPVPVVENILEYGPPHFCVSNSGTLAYLRNLNRKDYLVWVDFNGEEEKLNVIPDSYQSPRVSPNGNRIAIFTGRDSKNFNIGILDIVRGNIIHPSQNIIDALCPIWSSDSQRIAFSGRSEDVFTMGLYQMLSSGTGKAEHLYTEPTRQIYPTSFSKDGKVILCQIGKGINIRDIGMLTIDEDPQWKIILQDEYNKNQTNFSPDDKWIAYTSDRSGRNEVYVRSFPEVEEIWEQISTDGGDSPLWSPNSQQIYYRNSDHVIAATYETKQGFKVIDYEILFKDTYNNSAPVDISWDIHPDGKRFLMIKEAAADTRAEGSQYRIDIIQNWFEELKQRVPVD